MWSLQDPMWGWHNGAYAGGVSAMTGRANSLTERVAVPGGAANSTMTLAAHDLRVLLDGLGRLGYDVHALMAAARLEEADFAHPDARVSCDAYGAVLARACRERFVPNLALELARVTPLGAWPLIDYLVVTADTLWAGMRQLSRYIRVTGARFSFK